MEEELKEQIAGCVASICSAYEKVLSLLQSISGGNVVLSHYIEHLTNTLKYASLHYMDAVTIDLAVCKQRHDPARLLNEVESRFKALEQGF